MRRLPAEAKPGKKWVYSTGETHLLGVLVSAATGQSLSDYLSSKIWIPYGMEEKATWILGRTDEELAGCCLQMQRFVISQGSGNLCSKGDASMGNPLFPMVGSRQRPICRCRFGPVAAMDINGGYLMTVLSKHWASMAK